MNYYKLEISKERLKTIFYAELPKGYSYGTYDSVHNLQFEGKLDFIPNLKNIKLKESFNPNYRDMLDITSTGIGGGIIISDKFLSVLNKHELPQELQIFDVDVIYEKKHYHYNYFYLFKPKQKEFLNFSKMTFLETNMIGEIKKELVINSYEDYLSLKKKDKLIQIKPEKIILKDKVSKPDIFNLSDIGLGYYVSESLKEQIINAKCNGIAFVLL